MLKKKGKDRKKQMERKKKIKMKDRERLGKREYSRVKDRQIQRKITKGKQRMTET